MLSTTPINFSSSSIHKGCFVMPGHSRSKNAVPSLAYVPGIHVLVTSYLKDVDGRDNPGHDGVDRSYIATIRAL